MASGAWGGGGAKVPRMVKRTGFVQNRITEPDPEPIQGAAAKLKYYPEPNYHRPPFDPDFDTQSAKATDRVRHGR